MNGRTSNDFYYRRAIWMMKINFEKFNKWKNGWRAILTASIRKS